MRLWHESLIPYLPRIKRPDGKYSDWLLGQHREVCALRGNGWGKKHSTVDYVFRHSMHKLYLYHMVVMAEMEKRGYVPSKEWKHPYYRGKNCRYTVYGQWPVKEGIIYPEHTPAYLQECLANLKAKGIEIEWKEVGE